MLHHYIRKTTRHTERLLVSQRPVTGCSAAATGVFATTADAEQTHPTVYFAASAFSFFKNPLSTSHSWKRNGQSPAAEVVPGR